MNSRPNSKILKENDTPDSAGLLKTILWYYDEDDIMILILIYQTGKKRNVNKIVKTFGNVLSSPNKGTFAYEYNFFCCKLRNYTCVTTNNSNISLNLMIIGSKRKYLKMGFWDVVLPLMIRVAFLIRRFKN